MKLTKGISLRERTRRENQSQAQWEKANQNLARCMQNLGRPVAPPGRILYLGQNTRPIYSNTD